VSLERGRRTASRSLSTWPWPRNPKSFSTPGRIPKRLRCAGPILPVSSARSSGSSLRPHLPLVGWRGPRGSTRLPRVTDW